MSDRLILEGRLQVETAQHALIQTGKDPAAEQLLGNLLICHELTTANDPQSHLYANFGGQAAEQTKQALIESLIEVEQAPSTDPARLVLTQDLLEILLADYAK